MNPSKIGVLGCTLKGSPFLVFFGTLGVFSWGSRILAGGLFFQSFWWKFRVGPFWGSAAGRLNPKRFFESSCFLEGFLEAPVGVFSTDKVLRRERFHTRHLKNRKTCFRRVLLPPRAPCCPRLSESNPPLSQTLPGGKMISD